MDKLSSVLSVFSFSAGIIYSGQLCGLSAFDDPDARMGHIHFVKKGRLHVTLLGQETVILTAPALLLFPRPTAHVIEADKDIDTEIVCAEVHYGAGPNNPLTTALPPLVTLSLKDAKRIESAAQWLFEEAFSQLSARELVMNRLCEVVIIHLLRHVFATDQVNTGMMAGLSHPKLSKTLEALHANPAKDWSLLEMAQTAAFSRARFALVFRSTLGQTPGDYLAGLRIEIAKRLLQQGKPVGWVANEVGYVNASALARVFRNKTGETPKGWQKKTLEAC